LASGSMDGTARLWDVEKGSELRNINGGHVGPVTALALSPDGQRLATAAGDKTIDVWDVSTGRYVLTFRGHTAAVTSVAFSPGGKRLASAGDDETVRLWDAERGQEVLTLKGHSDPVSAVAFSPDGTRLASASWDKTVRIWDAYKRYADERDADKRGASPAA